MGEKLRLLLVEESEDDAALLLEDLRAAGFDVDHVRVGTKAAMEAALAHGPWDIVVSDYRMPTFDAPGALEVLRGAGLDISVIIVSGTAGEEAAVAALKAGAHDFFVKGRHARLAPAIRRELSDSLARRERRAAEIALRESEELFREMAETIDDVFWVSETAVGPLRYVSPAFERLFGQPRSPLDSISVRWREALHPDDRDRVVRVAQDGENLGTYDVTYRVVRPDGAVRWVRDRSFSVRDAQGAVVRMIGVAQDVTAVTEGDLALRRSEEQLRQAQKMEAVGRLAGGIAHDFNNMLTVIGGFGQVALDVPGLPAEAAECLGHMVKAGERAAELTHQLLAFSRKQVLRPSVLDLNDLLAGMVPMLKRMIGEDVELTLSRGAGLGHVRADRGQLEQIVANLAVNSRDAMPDGGRLSLATGNADLDESYAAANPGARAGRYVLLSVSDAGCGMSAETKRRLFEPFFTTKAPGKGTGLGLATCYGIVQQSGGHVAVYSELGHGTTVRVYLPRVDGDVSQPVVLAAESPAGGSETILLVEDDAAVRALTARVLAGAGYRVIEAGSGAAALGAAEAHEGEIDLVLTDTVMPGMSGRQFADRLRLTRPGAAVLYMSGYTDDAVVRHGVLEEGVEFLEKPFTPKRLLRKVRDVIDGRGRQGGPR